MTLQIGHRVAFRYQSLAIEPKGSGGQTSRDYTFGILKNNSLRLSGHEDFLDWFDCRPPRNIKFQTFCEGMLVKLEEEIKKNPEKEERIRDDMKVFENRNDDARSAYRQVHENTNNIIATGGIKSFCGEKGGVRHNNNMWLQYSDRYKGICLVFDVSDPLFQGLRKVNYVEERLPLDMATTWLKPGTKVEGVFDCVFLQKSKDFEYENEYRIVRENGAGAIVTFRKASLIEVQFGFNILTEDRKAIVDCLQEQKYPNVTFFDMIPEMVKSNFQPLYVGQLTDGQILVDEERTEREVKSMHDLIVEMKYAVRDIKNSEI